MSLELLEGYFYDQEGNLLIRYQGYGNLEDLDDLLEHRKPCVGFCLHKSINADTYIYDIENKIMVEKN